MFKRKLKPVVLNATKAYLVEMTRAILRDQLKTEVFLTQVVVEVQSEEKDADALLKKGRPYAVSQMEMSVAAFFTSLDYPRRHGHEGQPPILPKVEILFLMTSEVAGWYNWQILLANGEFKDFYEPQASGKLDLIFLEANKSTSTYLKNLAKELELRRPVSYRTH